MSESCPVELSAPRFLEVMLQSRLLRLLFWFFFVCWSVFWGGFFARVVIFMKERQHSRHAVVVVALVIIAVTLQPGMGKHDIIQASH